MILLDTDVMIDVLRGHPPAVAWLESVRAEEMGLPGLVLMEIIQGCRDLEEQKRVERLVAGFALLWPTEADCRRALADFVEHRLAGGLGLLDSLIAETSIGRGAPLATFNEKHYRSLGALRTVRPYARNP
ncbi:MAG: PIN domain-containing protein [Deltaproteobacteria bacterium]|nr:PIN domain-containing protein [Deltaproteobacteria bacterium]